MGRQEVLLLQQVRTSRSPLSPLSSLLFPLSTPFSISSHLSSSPSFDPLLRPHSLAARRYPSDPEFSQCMSEIDFATDPVTGDGKQERPWSELTRGLWKRHADGSLADGSDDLLGQSWKQLTAGLWREKPVMERNGMDY